MIFIGVDPGLTGACCVLDHNGVRAIFDLPTMKAPEVGPDAKVQRKIDGRALLQLLLKHCPAEEGKPTIIIEKVGTMGGQNNAVQTQGALMRTLGAIETVMECMTYPVHYVAPRKWKSLYKLGSVKAESLDKARGLYQSAAHDLRLQKHHNRAEALLLARWGKVELS